MKQLHRAAGLIVLFFLLHSCKPSGNNTGEAPPYRPALINPDPVAPYLSPQASMKKIFLPEGYHLQLVASEPMIQEPVTICWDGDGRMYVAEMITYMQDVNGSKENLPLCRILRLEDTNGDGVMDKSTVFIDSLVLPRMMLPLGRDGLVVNDTYSYDLWCYKDTNGDGVADEKTLMYHNDAADTRNLEHQRSGLIWNIDNWIYLSRDPVRYRLTGGRLVADTFAQDPGGQWGLARDNYGRLFFSSAGGGSARAELPAKPGLRQARSERPAGGSFRSGMACYRHARRAGRTDAGAERQHPESFYCKLRAVCIPGRPSPRKYPGRPAYM